MYASLGAVANTNQAIVALLKQTPNQPFFGDLTEDALISYTLHNWKRDKDYSWPLLFPMVKSAVKAMDAVQEFSKKN
jgi:PhoPQ-activated pathogenicity-related protein